MTCPHHPDIEILYDTFGYAYCPDCDDEIYERSTKVVRP